MNIKEEIFRAYDIRGIYKKDLNEEIAEIIGKAFGTFIGENKKIVIGRDVRISSENLEKSFINGLLKTGCQIIPIGLIHTPLLYFVIIHYSLDGGVMITASVDYNEYTLVKDLKSNQTKLVKIGEFIEDNHDKFKNFAVLAFNPENGRVSFQKIEEVYKHKINEPLYELILEHGRRVKVTASHSVFTFRDNKLISLPTSQLKIGDLIPVINYIPNNPHIPEINIVKEIWPYRNELRKIILTGKDIIKINLLRSRKQKKQRVKLKIEGKKFLRDLREKLGLTRKEVAKHSGLSMMSIQRIELLQKREFIKRTTLEKYLKFLGLDTKEFLTNFASNIDYFEQMLKDGKTFNYLELQKLKKEDLKNIKECYLHGYGYPNNPIKNLIRVTPELVKLIGYYLAEGNLECEDRVTFTLGPLKKGHEKLIAKEIIFSCKRVFGITPKIYRYKSKTKLVIDNVVVYSLFAKVFKFEKKNSNTKTLPDFVYTLPKELILELLRCIFLGDGTIMKDGIKFSSASEELAIGISYLLSMLSVNFSFNKKESKKNRKNLFEIYVGKNDLGKIKKIWKDHYRAKQLSLKVKKSHKEFKLNDLLLLPLKEIRRVSPSSEYVYDFSVKSGTFIAGIGICCHNSHNPPEWNGFKLCKEKAILCGQGMGMEEIKSIAFSKKFNISNKGKIIKKENIMDDYKKFILSKIEIEKGLRIGIDPGNGSCSIIAKKILEEKGLEVFSINDFPDGRFPAHLPEPTEENLKELQELVIEKNLDFGAGFDGDGDRAVFIDDKGRIIRGDITLAILVNHYLTKEKPEKIVYEVSCSKALEETIREKGGIPIISRVGHAFILDKMIKENALFGGEISSHLYFREIYGLDDSIFACLKMSELLSQSNSSLSKLIEKIPKYYSIPPKNFDCPDNLKFKIVEEIKNEMIKEGYETIAIDGVRVELNEGWFLIRASNTQPQIRMIAEAKNEEALNKIVNFAKEKLFEKLKEENIKR